MKAAIFIAIIALVVLVNAAALYAGHERHKLKHNLATLFGSLGLFCFLGLLVAFADAFTQVWVKRPGYEGPPVFIFFYATIATTLSSLITTIAIIVDDFRAEA